MNNKLKEYFPMLKTREEVFQHVSQNAYLMDIFQSWEEEDRERFLDFCSGARGVKMTYDVFFKEIMNPEYDPSRLEELLTILLNEKVKIREILPNDSTRIADETSLLITDIVVELENGSLVNIEIQKIGLSFPAERCACYSSDLLLRQYKRVRNKKKKKFSYKDIKAVYSIVFFEKSVPIFHELPDQYIHRGETIFDTGLSIEIPQKYILIPLDIFAENRHNYGIRSELDAWLSFLTQEKPEEIVELIQKYPRFEELYENLYSFCQDIERVMEMFSKELHEMDKNIIQYMIEEQQEIIDKQKQEVKEKEKEIEKRKQEVKEKEKEIEKQKQEAKEQAKKQEKEISELKAMIRELQQRLEG